VKAAVAAKAVGMSPIKTAVARVVTWPIRTKAAIKRAAIAAPRLQPISTTKSHFKPYPSAEGSLRWDHFSQLF
jgi:hypothetical protein